MKKIYTFIDAQNLQLSIKSLGWKIDYNRFFVYLQEKYKSQKIFLFIGYQKENKKLYSYLKNIGYKIVFKPTILKNGKIKGNCDGELILHAAAVEYNNYDSAIVITGDGDFHCLLKFLEEKEKLYKLGIPNRKSFSSLLKRWNTIEKRFLIQNLKSHISKKGA